MLIVQRYLFVALERDQDEASNRRRYAAFQGIRPWPTPFPDAAAK